MDPPPLFTENPQASPRGLRWYIPSSFLPASECRHHSLSRREALIMTKPPLWSSVVVSSLCTLTAVANGVVIFIIIRRPRLHNTGNCFVLSLAVADFFVGLSLVPYSFLCHVDEWKCDHDSVEFIAYFFLTASITNLCGMVADRYISVVKSLRYNELVTSKRVAAVISVAWLVPGVVIGTEIAVFTFSGDGHHSRAVFMLAFVLLFVICSSVFLVFATGRMILIARKLSLQTTNLEAQLNFNQPQGEEEAEMQLTRRKEKMCSAAIITSVVVGCFVTCYAVEAYYTISETLTKNETSLILVFFSTALYAINSLLNPIAYALIKGDIKTELGQLSCHVTQEAQTSLPVPGTRSERLQTSSVWSETRPSLSFILIHRKRHPCKLRGRSREWNVGGIVFSFNQTSESGVA